MRLVRAERGADPAVLTLTLDRPDRHNAVSAALVEELLAGVQQAYREPTDLLVLRGAGPTFSAGFDLSGLDTAGDGELLHRFVRIEQLLHAVHHAPFATLALAHGRVFGAGADLVCACTHRVADPDARFRLPGMAFGIVLGTGRLAGRVGPDRARRIQADGETVDAPEALASGLVTAVHPRDGWDDLVAAHAARERALPRAARAVLQDVLHDDRADRDLAALARSAAEPGLARRIHDYASGRHR
ncbi:enoyl-CoA hydratase/isomerase family protein [Pseudonocardia sp. HH130630-07]|uniref:enoyl-CoA hydratase/isomerase family protein n=1 Tax=Pseudonocardia sp. HH130630-07 TaxID=1690815 RepID=UPI000814FC3B|nr:enoyl-CoA hydratase/isomerase family protein [Pseudonocardia sp. HH130630-07]ANY08332.1 hypothetical protein AFB00_20935 [Pseudonocardia sp. HH130630-07]